ncbi:pentapeptide repeat-containing protein [Geobacter sp. FeAm09]|uniref:pentapeptide repeat-containing protein n=1 Tax=Geobacter sp. FeAm09 TaxID=2597769 RepID=UPI0011EC0B60|nr:pentapeptide repeat-containing protein [Geobacter sp. FeAm09]QEM69290.1 pentapeptide repeat-containing protein [Geobacter sp. FeAm09]
MTIFRVFGVAAALCAAAAVTDGCSSGAWAAEGAGGGSDPAVPVAADQASPAPKKSLGAVVPKKVKKKKTLAKSKALHKAAPAISETAPGKRLSLEEVLALLKAGRDLSGRNLSGMNLTGVNLGKCNLKGADLSNANLERADLGEADLERANLAGANLRMVSLKLSGLTGANLDNAILDGAIWQDGRICGKGSLGVCREAVSPFASR